jgi:predicted aspartyl protease
LKQEDIIALQTLQIDNYVKSYRYKAAAVVENELIKNYSKNLDTAKLSDLQNTNILWNALSRIAPQEMIRNSGACITWSRDVGGLIDVPVIINGHRSQLIFDTSANISTVSESSAKLFHLQLIKTSFDLGSGTSVNNKASLAVAKDLKIGTIELKNVVFIVFPDDQLSFPQITYIIHGIIGFPVISQL